MSEKTEQPTGKRLRDARKKGQVVKSVEVTSAAQLGVITLLLALCGQQWYQDIQRLLQDTLQRAVQMDEGAITALTIMWAAEVAKILGTVACALTVATLAALFGQVGILFSGEAIAKGAGKLNVIANLKQMFSVKNLFELTKSVVKIVLIGLLFFIILRRQFSAFQYAAVCGAGCAMPLLSHVCFELLLGLLGGYLFFGAADYAFQRFSLMKQLRMTKEEVKQEFKDSEGNPEIKQRRREAHREMQQEGIRQKVRSSSVIIKNPTHLSVCLWFDPARCPLPKVIEKAQGERARMINALAEREGVAVVENIPLARGLMRDVAVGQFITPAFYEPVAGILRVVMGLDYDPEPQE
ncbi:EscU/YscU/HrcU family type III secretion system export apparatus switch protein [Erwinia sp. HR93]|uniref:EscU/YscU/HrcU family type III secretion system export apparatus switch protein n=1 Tax=Erwinia sp. HR93 TaxID=3094840 RepID=UPI002ADEDF24|nr:EscU/YscU/HrcU family type III secretion system export apparatus switch protein [Erwinia sp. HR93]MEA1063804.1 EscU/YscU/HrcU family type III secretion system export apparatus switch protein [Erwinia sp. HR93]